MQGAQDVIEELTDFSGIAPTSLREPPRHWDKEMSIAQSGEPADVAGLLTTAPVGVDELIRQSGAAASAVQLALVELELAGKLVRHAGGRVSLG